MTSAAAPALIVTLDGPPGSGRTTLARALAQAFMRQGHAVQTVPDLWTEFSRSQGRAPHPGEWRGLAEAQSLHLAQAAATPSRVVADTTALTTAIRAAPGLEGEHLPWNGMPVLPPSALRLHFLTAFEPLSAAPAQRLAGERFNMRLRSAFAQWDLPCAVLAGPPPARLENALAAVAHALRSAGTHGSENGPQAPTAWRWHCDRCSDADCERHLLPRIASGSSS